MLKLSRFDHFVLVSQPDPFEFGMGAEHSQVAGHEPGLSRGFLEQSLC